MTTSRRDFLKLLGLVPPAALLAVDTAAPESHVLRVIDTDAERVEIDASPQAVVGQIVTPRPVIHTNDLALISYSLFTDAEDGRFKPRRYGSLEIYVEDARIYEAVHTAHEFTLVIDHFKRVREYENFPEIVLERVRFAHADISMHVATPLVANVSFVEF